MMVANSFDLWQKDAFFSAAEEVQESADIMESAYRLWVRERSGKLNPEDLRELSRELQTALGTAKWQLDEFEKAVRLTQGHARNDYTTARHRQFIEAIENQISRVELSLKEALNDEGKQTLRWINLDEEERDDLAIFLSGSSSASSSLKDECIKFRPFAKNSALEKKSDESKVSNSEFVIQVEEDSSGKRDDIFSSADKSTGTRRTWSLPNFDSLNIVIGNEDEEQNRLLAYVESTPKEKRSKPGFRKQKYEEQLQARGAIRLFHKLFTGIQRRRQNPVQLRINCSVRLLLALMITVFLIVPFLLYST